MSWALDAHTVAQRVRDLPALPAALREVLRATQDDHLRSDGLAALIEHDQALCGRVLRLANSAFYGLRGSVGTIHDAVQLLGLRNVASMMTTALLASYNDVRRCAGFDFDTFWRHAIAVSIAAREIALARDHDAHQATVTGLLHDVGQLAMATLFPQAMSAALELGHSADCEIHQAEQSVLGLNHAEIGALLTGHWHLPPIMVQAIARHHAPPGPGAGPDVWLIDTLHLADAIAHALDLPGARPAGVPDISLDSWERLTMHEIDSALIFARVEQGLASLIEALHA